jgi:hypothetical protein
MRLCFGTYAKVLTLFLKSGRTNKELLHAIVRSVDPACKLSESAVSLLLSCQSNLPNGRANSLGDVIDKAETADPETVACYFAARLPDMFVHKDRQLIILALLDLIFNDEAIDGDTILDKVGFLTKDALRKLDTFALSDFLAGVFLYVAGVDNKCGKHEPDAITREYVDSFDYKKDSIKFIVKKRSGDKTSADESIIDYMICAKMKYGNIKTLLYKNEPKPFYDFYVPNHVEHRSGRSVRSTYTSVTVESLTKDMNFIILGGIGGLGKSMMLKHLLLDAIAKYNDFRHVPIFVYLKDYTGQPLSDFVCSRITLLHNQVSRDAFDAALASGLCLLLFDGLDEMDSTRSKIFERELEEFADRYPKNLYVISSRPYQSFAVFTRFTVLQIKPFTKEQSIELIKRIDFREDEPDIKAKFFQLIQSNRYDTHRSFIENPLLLTIMLLTFERFADIPTKMHNFYREAFVTLYKTHDANKGSYRRTFKSALDMEDFSDYFAEFCFHSYRESKTEFTDIEFADYFDRLQINDFGVKSADFAFDLYANLCLMLLDGNQYSFTHHSFQEYFCALFFSKQNEKFMRRLGDFFELHKERMLGDRTFDMLYDMARVKVEANILIPYLQELFGECDEGNGYWTFLKRIYPVITYEKDEMNDYTTIVPTLYLYGFVAHLLNVDWKLHCEDLPENDNFLINEYGSVHTRDGNFELVSIDDMKKIFAEYDYLQEEPEAEGWRYQFTIDQVHNRFEHITEVLEDDRFVFKMEYDAARRYFDELVSKHQRKDDFFAGLF